MSSSVCGMLTAEQRHRIEENKRKALALRAAKQPNCANVPASQRPPGGASPSPRLSSPAKIVSISRIGVLSNSVVRSPVKTAFPLLHANDGVAGTRTTQFYGASGASKPPCSKQQTYFRLGGASRQTSSMSANAAQSHRDTKTSQSPSKWAPSSTQLSPKKAQKLSGKCVLISRYRFVVDIGYSTPLIAVFHSMSTKQYDLQAKRWSFELQEYTELLRKIRDIGDTSLQVEPLAKAVLVAFNDHVRDRVAERRIPSTDLSRIGNALVSTLMPFQKEGVNFAILRGGRVLIADDMGLGKTLQAICVATYYRHEWPLLIVAPSSVRFTWREQLLRWLDGSIDPQQINVVANGKQSSTSGLINITSYDLMARSVIELKQKNFRVIIMDESHLLKNSKTARSKAAASLLKTAKRVILLSGTPALSRPSELFVQINAVNHKAFPQFHDFGLRYCNGQQLAWGWDFSGSSNMEELQLVLEECVMIRRMKKDVMRQLPPKTRQMVVLDPGSIKVNNHMKQAHKLVNSSKGSERRGTLLQYFHETGTAKIPAVREYIMDLLESDRKILVFAHHQVVLDALEEAVTAKNHQHIRIDGRNSSEQRNLLCERFQSEDAVRVAVLSISAANAGLHLTAASVVVFAELFWNPGILMQAEDRAHRIGQEDSVNVHYLVAQRTADDYIWPLVQQKLDVLGKVGLSKDNFSNADTKYMQDPKQQDLLKYFEESFIESEAMPQEADSSAQHSKPLHPAAYANQSGNTSKMSMLNHFKPEIGQCGKNETEDDGAEGDWLDDIEGLFEGDGDDDPDAPWPPKRLKT